MNFYYIVTDAGRRKRYTWSFPAYGYPGEAVSCEKCKRRWISYDKLYEENTPFPIVFVGDYFSDFLSCEGLKLVNENVKKTFEEKGIKSPFFSRMSVVTKNDMTKEQYRDYARRKGYDIARKFHNEQPVYYWLGAKTDAKYHKDSNVILIDSGNDVCKHCGYGVRYASKNYSDPDYIDLSSWGGNDIFRVTGLGVGLYCTEKVKKLCEEHGFTGVSFVEIEAR